jgi:hypothetical protein
MQIKVKKYLKDNNINFVPEKMFEWLKNILNLKLDFYLLDYNVAIEVQGEQHFHPTFRFDKYESL